MAAQTDPKVQLYTAILAKATISNTMVRNIGKLEDPKEIERAAKFLLGELEIFQTLASQLPVLQSTASEMSPYKPSEWELLPKELQEKLGLNQDAMSEGESGETARTAAQPDVNALEEEFRKIFWENMLRRMDSQQALTENPIRIAPSNVVNEENEEIDVQGLVAGAVEILPVTCLLVMNSL